MTPRMIAMTSAAGLALSMGCGTSDTAHEIGEVRVVAGCRIQDEIDAAVRTDAGGLVVIPAGTCMINAPIVLPRTTLGGRGGVQLEGEGSQVTFLVASESFPAGRGLIEWAPASGDETSNDRRWRAWSQRIAGMTLILQRAPGKGIWYHRTTEADPAYEKAQFTIEDVAIESWMNWEQTAIRLEGNVHDTVIRQVELDIGIRGAPAPARTYDGKGIVFDDGEDDGNDDHGAFNLEIDGLSTTPRSNGLQGHAVSGRVMFGTLRNIKIGRGSRSAPQIRLVGSFATTVSMISEGSAESSQILVENSRGIAIEDSLLGTPNAVTTDGVTYPTGDGITFRDCDGCSVRNWPVHEDKPLWDRLGAARVRLDAASAGCEIDIMTGGSRWGDEDPLRVVIDQGRNNRIVTQNARTGEIVERYNGQRI